MNSLMFVFGLLLLVSINGLTPVPTPTPTNGNGTPSEKPTPSPTAVGSNGLTPAPTPSPTPSPAVSPAPTNIGTVPTPHPTSSDGSVLTPVPTARPTSDGSVVTPVPTSRPTNIGEMVPTARPSPGPTPSPGTVPTSSISFAPTKSPINGALARCVATDESLDVIFMVDSSGSVYDDDYKNWENELDLVYDIIDNALPVNSRVGLINFSGCGASFTLEQCKAQNRLKKMISLTDNGSPNDLNAVLTTVEAIGEADFNGGYTWTNEALTMALEEFLLTMGGPTESNKMVILISDGEPFPYNQGHEVCRTSTNYVSPTLQSLRDIGVDIISVGIDIAQAIKEEYFDCISGGSADFYFDATFDDSIPSLVPTQNGGGIPSYLPTPSPVSPTLDGSNGVPSEKPTPSPTAVSSPGTVATPVPTPDGNSSPSEKPTPSPTAVSSPGTVTTPAPTADGSNGGSVPSEKPTPSPTAVSSPGTVATPVPTSDGNSSPSQLPTPSPVGASSNSVPSEKPTPSPTANTGSSPGTAPTMTPATTSDGSNANGGSPSPKPTPSPTPSPVSPTNANGSPVPTPPPTLDGSPASPPTQTPAPVSPGTVPTPPPTLDGSPSSPTSKVTPLPTPSPSPSPVSSPGTVPTASLRPTSMPISSAVAVEDLSDSIGDFICSELGSTRMIIPTVAPSLMPTYIIEPSPKPTTEPTLGNLKGECSSSSTTQELDIIFMVDSSGSVYDDKYINWQSELDLVNDIIQSLPGDKSRVSLINFSGCGASFTFEQCKSEGRLETVFGLDTYQNLELVSDKIESMSSDDFLGGYTWTDDALGLALTQFNDNSEAATNKIIVLLTDGEPYPYDQGHEVCLTSQDYQSPTLAALNELNVDIITIGIDIDESIRQEKMTCISSSYFGVSHFLTLQSLSVEIGELICDKIDADFETMTLAPSMKPTPSPLVSLVPTPSPVKGDTMEPTLVAHHTSNAIMARICVNLAVISGFIGYLLL